MFTEKYLRELGFSGFEHLDKNKRDCLKRLSSVLFIEDACFTIRLVLKNNQWQIDKFSFEGDEKIFKKFFQSEPTLEEIIQKLFIT